MYTEEELQEMCIGDLIAIILDLQETVNYFEGELETSI
jgi:hypothetical protein